MSSDRGGRTCGTAPGVHGAARSCRTVAVVGDEAAQVGDGLVLDGHVRPFADDALLGVELLEVLTEPVEDDVEVVLGALELVVVVADLDGDAVPRPVGLEVHFLPGDGVSESHLLLCSLVVSAPAPLPSKAEGCGVLSVDELR